MILLFFLVLFIQFFTNWVFNPLVFSIEYLVAIKFFPLITLIGFIFLFSAKNNIE